MCGEGHGFTVWGLRPLVAGVAQVVSDGIDGGLAAEFYEVFAFAGGEEAEEVLVVFGGDFDGDGLLGMRHSQALSRDAIRLGISVWITVQTILRLMSSYS